MQPDELKALRKAAKLTQGKLAEEIGMSLGHVGDMERGDVPIGKTAELAIRYVIERRHVVGFGERDVVKGIQAESE